LSADKDRVLAEAFRVLKPGGRFAVSDVVTRGEMLPEIRQSVLLWVGCVAGALAEDEYQAKLKAAGFENIDIEPTRVYRIDDARTFLGGQASMSTRSPRRSTASSWGPSSAPGNPRRSDPVVVPPAVPRGRA
jgi:hypothetical protein